MAEETERRTVYFCGTVQGVGFRYTTCHIARDRPVTVYVRNLPNGEVEITVEGYSRDLDAFLAAVERRFGGHIEGTRATKGIATGEFDSFSVRH